ncbi:MAG: DUF3244 domain-containing protein [Bacteroidales bacterium]|nr:DUF3244 domain-containing protein [Bacteroidales bacterium]
MKRTKILLSLVFCALASMSLQMFAEDKNGAESNPQTGIEFIKHSPNQPRTLVQDIEAYHTNNMVYLTFNENLGLANIVISNTNTGAQVETSVPTTCSNVQVDISSLGQGNFEIVINTAQGTYSGVFCL